MSSKGRGGYKQVSEGQWRSFFAQDDYKTDSELAARVGVTRTAVVMARKRYNIPPKLSNGHHAASLPDLPPPRRSTKRKSKKATKRGKRGVK